jgi:hypothetical protein
MNDWFESVLLPIMLAAAIGGLAYYSDAVWWFQ